MLGNRTVLPVGLLLPQIAWASDYSGLMPLYIGVVLLIGGFLAGIEWAVINAVMDRGEEMSREDSESQYKSRFGCGLAAALWAVNSLATHAVFRSAWG